MGACALCPNDKEKKNIVNIRRVLVSVASGGHSICSLSTTRSVEARNLQLSGVLRVLQDNRAADQISMHCRSKNIAAVIDWRLVERNILYTTVIVYNYTGALNRWTCPQLIDWNCILIIL